jgi:mannose-6-phosphate isomerase-like protein (cupin superfamily)
MRIDKIMKNIKVVKKHWGEEKWIADGISQPYALKKILFRAGNRTSLQVHQYKYETNYVLSGTGKLFVSKEKLNIEEFLIHGMTQKVIEDYEKTFDIFTLSAGDIFDIPPGYVHRVVATIDLVFIEASTPELDDVIRLQDDKGRTHGRVNSEHEG